MKKIFCFIFRGALCVVFLISIGALDQVAAQVTTKGILPEEAGVQNRPPSKFTQSVPQRSTYKTGKKYTPKKTSRGQEVAQLGVTVWRFRPATTEDKIKEIEKFEENGKTVTREWALERLETTAPIIVGEKLRIGIESLSHSGYLYVIDRELYSDGTFGTPRLIFPTKRIRGGNNLVKPGELIYIPTPPRYFRAEQGLPNKPLVAEVLTILVSKKPLKLPEQVSERAMTLSANLIASWERLWKTELVQLDLEEGVGQPLTQIEELVGGANTKDLIDTDPERLTQTDPAPQTVFRTNIKSGNPLLVTLSLRFNTSKTDNK